MANKRMFNIKVVDSDAFLDMPLSTQALYFHLNMRADDDGFIGNPKRIQKIVGASEDDLKLLIAKRFLLTFEDGVIVIKHWRLHNTLSASRYTETVYTDEKKMLLLKENKSYSFTSGVPLDDRKQIETGKRGTKEAKTNICRTFDEHLTNTDIDKDIDIDKEIDIDVYTAPSDLENHSMPVIELTLNDKSLYPIFQDNIDEWKDLYQSVDILQELKKMKGWLNANPTKRKTKRGILKFINSWLSREQDKGYKADRKQSEFNITKFDL